MSEGREAMLSVLMPVYHKDKAEFFELALNSIEQQEGVYNELVVVGDGPLSDELYEVIDRHKKTGKLVYYEMEENKGLGAALQYGVLKCKGDYIARMDSDDVSEPNRFKEELEYLETHKDVSIVGGWISEFIDNPEEIISVRKVPEWNEEIRKYGKKRCPMNHMTVMFRKKDVEAAGNYRNKYYTNEDYDLWIRMINYGFIFHNIPKTMVRARVGEGMFERRGGRKYCQSELQVQKLSLELGYIKYPRYLLNCFERICLQQLMPARIRRVVYKCVLR